MGCSVIWRVVKMKRVLLLITLAHLGSLSPFFDLAANDIHGSRVEFAQFEDKVVLVVNVASECGFTDGHYRGLQRLYDILGNDGKLEILGFPCNQFGGQEPGAAKEIADLVSSEFGVEFRMMEKVEVKGSKVHPVWQYLTGDLFFTEKSNSDYFLQKGHLSFIPKNCCFFWQNNDRPITNTLA